MELHRLQNRSPPDSEEHLLQTASSRWFDVLVIERLLLVTTRSCTHRRPTSCSGVNKRSNMAPLSSSR
ncbi:unnamed protein product [Pleuronectes platessa]|uniref:Uncharacterized protein n=1 Tax=Pleuronectes platessa TaxID=8262 RepID=A0A9N7U465_PLEPL|nr:unnamed protein product [Pleuronectes platessa]